MICLIVMIVGSMDSMEGAFDRMSLFQQIICHIITNNLFVTSHSEFYLINGATWVYKTLVHDFIEV